MNWDVAMHSFVSPNSVSDWQLADVESFETKLSIFQDRGIQHSTNITSKQIAIVTLSHHTHLTFLSQMIINCYCSPLRIPFPFTFDSFSLKWFQLSAQTHPQIQLSKSFCSCLFSYFGFEFSFSSFPFSMRLYLCCVVCVCTFWEVIYVYYII